MGSGVTGGGKGVGGMGQSAPPPRLLTGKFLLTYQKKKRSKEKKEKAVKIEKKRRQIIKGKVQKLEMGENGRWTSYKLQNEERTFFFFLFFVLFCFVLFLLLTFVLGLPKWKVSTGKKHFTPGKNRKNDFAPQKNFPVTPLPMGKLHPVVTP